MAKAKRSPKRAIAGDAKVSIRAGGKTNRIHLDVKLSKKIEERLYQILRRRYS